MRFALTSELFSHILLIPFICGYLVLFKRPELRTGTSPDRRRAWLLAIAGVAVLAGFWLRFPLGAANSGSAFPAYLTCTSLSFVLLLIAICCFCLNRQVVNQLAFPMAFLMFMVPLPVWLTAFIETFLQYGSALSAQVLFGLTGMPVVREGLKFQLPGIRLEVAPECSGIHSTLVLFITSLLAGELFLRTPWKRAAICLLVVPLGIFRNALRICTIGQLCVHIGPHMIDSPIHRHGGPLFFLASLIPLFAFLWLLRRSEQAASHVPH